jgi:hypothetical protein
MINLEIDRIRDLVELGGDNLNTLLHKHTEEHGELTGEYLALADSSSKSNSAEGTKVALLSEACDVANSAIALLITVQKMCKFDDEFVNTMYDKKLVKWEHKLPPWKM